jgi:hypothetical protein
MEDAPKTANRHKKLAHYYGCRSAVLIKHTALDSSIGFLIEKNLGNLSS